MPLSQRIRTSLEVVVALLADLGIPHIALVAHSAGTIYALNLIAHHPNLLHPSHPTLTLFSPWVHQSISGNLSLKAAAALPNITLSYWNNLVGGIITKGAPALDHTSGVLTSVANLFNRRGRDVSDASKLRREALERKCEERHGFGLDLKNELISTTTALAWKQSTAGGNDEARLCLKSCTGTGWDRCEVYPTFVQDLKLEWAQRAQSRGQKLRIRIAFGEGEDDMICWKGMEYLEYCFAQEKVGEGVEVEFGVQAGADHDTIVDPMFEEIPMLYRRVKEAWYVRL